MYRLATEKIQPGMKLGRSIYSAEGSLLLRRDVTLTPPLIRHLKHLGISSLYIGSEFPALKLEEPPPLIQEKTRVQAVKTVQNAFHKCRLAGSTQIPAEQMRASVQSIIDNILANRGALIQAADIRRHDDYTFAHSVNVCVLSTMLAALLGYDKKRLYELSLGALLHDIGKTQVPLSILNKPARLQPEEFEIMQAHAQIGFELLRHTQSFSVVPMHAAFQHHERFDGSGYPRGLAGKDIHEYARIAAIADVFDALTADRAYKRACTPDIAHRIMTKESPGHFDPELLSLFFSNIAIYPVGTIVKLHSGYCAVVIQTQKGRTLTPQIRLIANAKNELIRYPTSIQLHEAPPKYQIERVVTEDELVDLFLHAKADHLDL